MADRFIQLTAAQEALVSLRDGAFLVLAPPGSGKTEVLSQRIVRLLREDTSATSRLLALTFTRKAAREMRERVEAHLGDLTDRARVTTYHGFADELLRQHGKPVGVTTKTTIYGSPDDRIEALGLAMEAEGLDVARLTRDDATALLERISREKRNLVLPDAAQGVVQELGVGLRQIYGAYERVLATNDAIDFDGLLVKAYELLTNYEGVAKFYRRLYRWILIDEGQDTCLAEYEVLRALCGVEYRNVFIVADRDQSIFRFRGASAEFLDRFASEFRAETFYLGANFRCAEEIVRTSYAFLEEDVAVPVRSHADARGWVGAYSFADEQTEARWVVDWLTGLLTTGLSPEWLAEGESPELKLEDLAVLARTRRLLDACTAELSRRGLPFVLVTGDSGVFDSEFFGLLLYALRVRANSSDLALRRAYLGQLGVDRDQGEAGDDGVRAFFADLVSAPAPLADLHGLLASSEGADATGAARWLTSWVPPETSDDDLAELAARDDALLKERSRLFINTVRAGDRSWQALVRALVEHPAPDKPGVRVMTVHGAKGLEFRAVAVVGMNEGSFPDFRSERDPADLQAERRLAYVAASRASRALVFTRSRNVRTRYGTRDKAPSAFLSQAGLRVQSA